jgi:hypothetical protein
MIIVKLLGGLGNQMFQYAFGRKLAYIHHTNIGFDLDGLFAGEDIRSEYRLNIFGIEQQRIPFAKTIKQRRKTIYKSTLLNNIYKKIYGYTDIHELGHFAYNENFIKNSAKNAYVRGLWQSEKYFKDISDIIRSEYQIKIPPNSNNQKIIDKINKSENAISLHVRRGEFADKNQFNDTIGTCNRAYYDNAISIMANINNKTDFFIFSDDIAWCKSEFNNMEQPTHFIDFNDSSTDYEDLRLMSLCKHQIIANSTFSWWGAWLNQNPDKIVIAPKKWFRGWDYDTKDLIPESWIRI